MYFFCAWTVYYSPKYRKSFSANSYCPNTITNYILNHVRSPFKNVNVFMSVQKNHTISGGAEVCGKKSLFKPNFIFFMPYYHISVLTIFTPKIANKIQTVGFANYPILDTKTQVTVKPSQVADIFLDQSGSCT